MGVVLRQYAMWTMFAWRSAIDEVRSSIVQQHETYNCFGDVEPLNLQGENVTGGVRRV